jgi:hypothetical protein
MATTPAYLFAGRRHAANQPVHHLVVRKPVHSLFDENILSDDSRDGHRRAVSWKLCQETIVIKIVNCVPSPFTGCDWDKKDVRIRRHGGERRFRVFANEFEINVISPGLDHLLFNTFNYCVSPKSKTPLPIILESFFHLLLTSIKTCQTDCRVWLWRADPVPVFGREREQPLYLLLSRRPRRLIGTERFRELAEKAVNTGAVIGRSVTSAEERLRRACLTSPRMHTVSSAPHSNQRLDLSAYCRNSSVPSSM